MCVCVCAFCFLSLSISYICFLTCPFLFLYLNFFLLSERKCGGEATFSQFPFFSTIVSLLKVSTFGQIEGGEKEIGQIEGGLGMAL